MDRLRFAIGQRVRIRDLPVPGHMRTPRYVRGRTGEVTQYCGSFRNPETLAYGGNGMPTRGLYRVRLRQGDLWSGYRGSGQDTLEIEIYEHWLAEVGKGAPDAP
ncbi:nitrile hydratase [Meridianimarinicoccus roseus]|uniref:Nitrile hydratase n=1 Tax=Meridianimarinicoccus roseus TaxID=2072018 RepID=A0A2V2LFW6_9RHOB|nr:SH3-like domain-containing protein [Meridianimarinicoccus roseus]PWR02087.1 nitrile hydratase [Meridianimarinicoccus roseus]